jgi:hypothetical protein
MDTNLFIFSSPLPFAAAKKLLTAIQKPAKNDSWQDWSGEEGFDTEVQLASISTSDIGKINLPAFISSIKVTMDAEIAPISSRVPDSIFLGGDEWVVPEYDCTSSVRFEIVEPELCCIMRYSFSKLTNRRFFGRKFNVCDRFVIEPSSEKAEGQKLPDAEAIDLVVNKLKDRFNFPGPINRGFLESLIMGEGGFCYDFDPKENDWLRKNFRKMVETLSEETTSERFRIDVRISIGGMAKFHGESRNVREDAQELLRRISEKNNYSSYGVTYCSLGPQDWKDREKSRKKWKKPIHQELGTLTLEDGTCATMKLRIEKEGYVFTLDFDDVDGLAAFRETKYFQKTHWNLGAE